MGSDPNKAGGWNGVTDGGGRSGSPEATTASAAAPPPGRRRGDGCPGEQRGNYFPPLSPRPSPPLPDDSVHSGGTRGPHLTRRRVFGAESDLTRSSG